MLRHCSIEELLEVRNGEGSVGAKIHVDECEECRDELDRLHQRVASLKALPSLNAPRDRWPQVREQIVAGRQRIWWTRMGWAAAAMIALALGANGLALWPAADSEQQPEVELQALVEQSAQLDSMLKSIEKKTRVVNGLTAVTIADLEDRIIFLDSRLSSARRIAISEAQLRALLEQRVLLMDALVNTHTKRTVNVGF
jgi:hypothetical protein